MPLSHGTHAVPFGERVPAAQIAQLERAPFGTEPGSHGSHVDEPVEACVPLSHGVHAVPFGECVPAGHASQKERSAEGALPFVHGVHATLAAAARVPSGQPTQCVPLPRVPAEQIVQLERAPFGTVRG